MLNRILLVGYGVVFFTLVNTYQDYRDNTLLVALAAAVITFGGLITWLVSIRHKK